jgi:WD40 repeat protein
VPFPLWNWRLAWSPDGRMVAAVDDVGRLFGGPGRSFAVWDAASGGLLFLGPRGLGSNDVLFAPDSSELLVSLGDAPPSIAVLSTTTWQIEREVEIGAVAGGVTFIGYSGDGRGLIGITGIGLEGGGSLVWMDAAALAVDREIDRIHDGSPKSFALSPSGSHIATGSSDGYVRVWDVERRALVHEFRIGDEQVQGVAFVSDSHLAVAPETGHIFIYTTDQAELIEIVRGSLTRGFTELECERFNFDDSCPTIDELRGN